jgi:hypothetical protein
VSSLHTHPRDDSVAWTDLTFPPAVELGAEALRSVWDAWFSLHPTVDGPLCAASTPLLLAMLRDTGDGDVLPHCSLILQGDARSWLVRQARADEFLGDSPKAVAASTGLEPWRFLSDQVEGWEQQPVPRRAVLIRLLTQLGFYEQAVALGAEGDHPAADYLAYEAGRAQRQYFRDSDEATDAFAKLATDGRVTSLRILSCTQLISILLRDRDGERGGGYWAEYGERLLPSLADTEPWLRALTVSRFWRAASFQYMTNKDTAATRAALDTATEAGQEAEELAATAQQRHAARENTRLLLDVTVKAGTKINSAEHVDRAAEQLLRIDGNEPSARYFVAAWLYRKGDVRQAAENYELGAQTGALRGAGAAYKALQCWRELGDEQRAERAARLLLELDPAARLPGSDDASATEERTPLR